MLTMDVQMHILRKNKPFNTREVEARLTARADIQDTSRALHGLVNRALPSDWLPG